MPNSLNLTRQENLSLENELTENQILAALQQQNPRLENSVPKEENSLRTTPKVKTTEWKRNYVVGYQGL